MMSGRLPSKEETPAGTAAVERRLSRRGFLKVTAAAAGVAAAGGSIGCSVVPQSQTGQMGGQIETYNCICRSNCMFSCRYTGFVREGRLFKLEVADYPEPGYTSSCLKGLSYLERIYSPTRIKHPLRRVGDRGAGQWEQISWEEAIAEAADRLKEIAEKHGPKAIVFDSCSGCYGYINGIYNPLGRLSGVLGATKPAVCYDYAAGHGINRVLGTGDWAYCNEPSSVLDSSMVIVWGTNPVFTAPHNWRWIQRAKSQGTKVVTIDPIKSATAHKSDEYIQITPGNDGYLALAMANYLIGKDLIDHDFLAEKSTGAFLVKQEDGLLLRKSTFSPLALDESGKPVEKDRFYVWDEQQGTAVLLEDAQKPSMEGSFEYQGIKVDTSYTLLKRQLQQYTIAEASTLCGISEEKIRSFAEELASQKAVSVNITYGLDHYVNGYLTTWAIAILLALTGNLAKPGAGFTGVFTTAYSPNITAIWAGSPEFKALNSQVPSGLLHTIFDKQELEGKPYPMKAIISYSSNPISNYAGQNNFFDKILPNLDYWVYLDMELTDSARYADLVLPVSSWYESEDIRVSYNNPYSIYQEKAIEPLYESKPDSEIAGLLGRAMGFQESFPEGFGFDEWANLLFTDAVSKSKGITLERFKSEKVIQTTGEPGVSWIRGLSAPFPSESGKVQLYTENPTPRLNYGQDLSARFPHEHLVYYRAPHEASKDNPLYQKYPLVFLQEHSRFRVHTQWFNTPMLKELDPEPLAKVNSIDAKARGVADGDIVEVFNDRGHAVLKCLIDESIAPGILSIPKGWQREQFIDGCFQELTNPEMDPYASAFSYYDSLVDFRKYKEV
jgi:molybdopterin-containing oxidoreductase family molybdopterin binding subunit